MDDIERKRDRETRKKGKGQRYMILRREINIHEREEREKEIREKEIHEGCV